MKRKPILFVTVVTLALGTGCIPRDQLGGAGPGGAPGEPAGARGGVQKGASGTGAGAQPASGPAFDANDPDVKLLVKGLNEFAFDLYKEIAKTEKGNIFFSPFSISSALAMTYAGARGKTAEEMAKVLHFPPELLKDDAKRLHAAFAKLMVQFNPGKTPDGSDPGFDLQVANALWAQKGHPFLKDFVETNRTHYRAALQTVDLSYPDQVAGIVNEWVGKQTRERITRLLDRDMLNSQTRLVLTNAVYFKGAWLFPFLKGEGNPFAPFWVSGTEKVSAPLMAQGGEFAHFVGKTFKSLQLDYLHSPIAMLILLPDKRDGIGDLGESLSVRDIDTCLNKCKLRRFRTIEIPKYKVTWSGSLLERMRAMGLHDLSDFSGMSGDKALTLAFLAHKAFVDVNEKGTEAGAATALGMDTLPPPDLEFIADHPFFYFIVDSDSECILFMGRLMDPTK